MFTKLHKKLAMLSLMACPLLSSAQQTPYLQATNNSGVTFKTIISANETAPNGYRMVGVPDGTGAFDNGDGTFTLLVNHEITNTQGVARAHGSIGSFVSKWIIKKSDLSIVSGSDLMQTAKLWNGSNYTSYTASSNSNAAIARFSRFCSADLPSEAAFYNASNGKGTQNRIYMNGEESGAEGRGMAHIVTGSEAGVSYELPYLGKFSWENAVALPLANTDKTVVAGMDDGTGGQVYFYIGTKTNSGSDIQKAGLTNGKLYGLKVTGVTAENRDPLNISAGAAFTLVDLGDVSGKTGAQLETMSNSNGVTNFLRPEDGSWNPNKLNEFYFATTDRYDQVKDGVGSQVGRSRLWKLVFTDINNPEQGGTIEAVLDGTEAGNMYDNFCFDNNGNVILLEDVGGQQHNGKILQYTPATDALSVIGMHDPARFGNVGISATSPFNNDEETSGVIDVSCILGNGWFIIVDQAHYGISSNGVVEGGQILAMYNPGSVFSAPTGVSSLCAGATTTFTHNAVGGIWSNVQGRVSVNNMGVATAISAGLGNVKYTVTNATGCTLSSTKAITVNPKPAIPNIMFAAGSTNPQAGCVAGAFGKNKTFSLTGSPVGGTWSATGQASITSNGIVTTSNTAGAASITYTVTSNGCSNSRTINGNVATCALKPTNSNEIAEVSKFNIFPNPAQNIVNVNASYFSGNAKLMITSINGIEQKSQTLSLGNNAIDISKLSKGIYFISIITDNRKTVEKLIVN